MDFIKNTINGAGLSKTVFLYLKPFLAFAHEAAF